jgi:hypothetical protein
MAVNPWTMRTDERRLISAQIHFISWTGHKPLNNKRHEKFEIITYFTYKTFHTPEKKSGEKHAEE